MYHTTIRHWSQPRTITRPIVHTFHVYDDTGFWLGTIEAQSYNHAFDLADLRFGQEHWSSIVRHSIGRRTVIKNSITDLTA